MNLFAKTLKTTGALSLAALLAFGVQTGAHAATAGSPPPAPSVPAPSVPAPAPAPTPAPDAPVANAGDDHVSGFVGEELVAADIHLNDTLSSETYKDSVTGEILPNAWDADKDFLINTVTSEKVYMVNGVAVMTTADSTVKLTKTDADSTSLTLVSGVAGPKSGISVRSIDLAGAEAQANITATVRVPGAVLANSIARADRTQSINGGIASIENLGENDTASRLGDSFKTETTCLIDMNSSLGNKACVDANGEATLVVTEGVAKLKVSDGKVGFTYTGAVSPNLNYGIWDTFDSYAQAPIIVDMVELNEPPVDAPVTTPETPAEVPTDTPVEAPTEETPSDTPADVPAEETPSDTPADVPAEETPSDTPADVPSEVVPNGSDTPVTSTTPEIATPVSPANNGGESGIDDLGESAATTSVASVSEGNITALDFMLYAGLLSGALAFSIRHFWMKAPKVAKND